MIYFLSATIGIGVFLIFFSFSEIRIKRARNELLDIKFMFVPDYTNIQSGIKGFQKGRFYVAKYLSNLINIERLRRNLRISGLSRHINEYDIIVIKFVSIGLWVIGICIFTILNYEGNIKLLVLKNVSFVSISLLTLAFMLFWDRYLIMIFDSLRVKHFYDQFGHFINIFSCSVKAGDNSYSALKSTVRQLSGEFRNRVEKCVSDYTTIGRTEALNKLKETVNVNLMDFFVSVIEDNDNDTNGLYEYLQHNLDDFLNHKNFIASENASKKSSILQLATLFGLISSIALIGTLLLAIVDIFNAIM